MCFPTVALRIRLVLDVTRRPKNNSKSEDDEAELYAKTTNDMYSNKTSMKVSGSPLALRLHIKENSHATAVRIR
jgi:hypothetical protein